MCYCFCFPEKYISITCDVYLLRNNIKCKYIHKVCFKNIKHIKAMTTYKYNISQTLPIFNFKSAIANKHILVFFPEYTIITILMAKCQKDNSIANWSYVFLALIHQYDSQLTHVMMTFINKYTMKIPSQQLMSLWHAPSWSSLERTIECCLKSYCSEIQHRFIPAVHIQHTILS